MATRLSPNKLITVYSPDGAEEQHTIPNARDLIYGAGYSWHKKKESSPHHPAPFAVPSSTQFDKSQTQEVLDKLRGEGAEKPVLVEEPEEEDEEATDLEQDELSEEEPTPIQARGRGRGKR